MNGNILSQTHDNVELDDFLLLPPDMKLLNNQYRVLVLSGGGEKGTIQLGFLHNLFLNGVLNLESIECFVGTSIGSIICYMLAIGFLPIELLTIIFEYGKHQPQVSCVNIVNIVNKFGLVSLDAFFETLKLATISKLGFIPTMKELYETTGKHLICVTHNLSANPIIGQDNTVYIDYLSHPNISCIEAIRMSSNIPLICQKYTYNKGIYVDGALSNNYPIEYASKRFHDKMILGVYTNNNHSKVNIEKMSIIDYIYQLVSVSYKMSNASSIRYTSENVHSVVISANVGINISFKIDKKRQFDMFSIGYNCAKELIEKETEVINICKRISKEKRD
jgi:predicted acylesterase/phospholipase RssA